MSESAAPVAAPAIGIERPRILVVDDELPICLIVRRTLSGEQYRVETTTSSVEALQRLREEPFDLLITDINMPELDGLTLAEQARRAQALVGVVIMTAYSSFDNMTRALHQGVSDFITKPFEIQDLRLTVARALKQQRLQRDNVRLQTLVKVFQYSEAISSTLDLSELCDIVVGIVSRETAARAVGLWLLESGGQLVLHGAGTCTPGADMHALAHRVGSTLQTHTMQGDEPADRGEPGHRLLGVPLQAQGEPIGVLVAAYDDTQPPPELVRIVANQAALAIRNARQFHALRELDRLKSEFIGIASHELRTPLSLVLGYSSLLRNRLAGRDRDNLQHIIDGAVRIGDIVDDLMHLRRSDDRQQRLALSRFDIWVLLRELVAELERLATEREVDLRLELPGESLEVVADREKISLALAHLVDNATKFMEEPGVVRIVGRLSELDEPDVVIEVHDTAGGIAPHEINRIFDRFYQSAPSATRSRSGLGVGLTITKAFVELHGGKIEVESTLGQGSVFRVRLPIVSAEL